jgi:hypothetical protein
MFAVKNLIDKGDGKMERWSYKDQIYNKQSLVRARKKMKEFVVAYKELLCHHAMPEYDAEKTDEVNQKVWKLWGEILSSWQEGRTDPFRKVKL